MGMGTQSVRIIHGSNVTIKQGDVAYGHTETCKVVLAFHAAKFFIWQCYLVKLHANCPAL